MGAATALQMLNPTLNPIATRQRFGQSYTYTQRKRRRTNTLGTKVRRIVSGMAEVKQKGLTGNTGITSNVIYTFGCNNLLTQGTDGDERIGDAVNFKNWHIRFNFTTPSNDTGAYSYRVIVFKSPLQFAAQQFATGDFTAADIFVDNSVITGAGFLSQTDPEKVTVLYDTTIDIASQITSIADSQTIDVVVPLNKAKFKYADSVNAWGRDFNYYMVLIPYKVGGTSGVTSAGGALYSTKVTFSDI